MRASIANVLRSLAERLAPAPLLVPVVVRVPAEPPVITTAVIATIGAAGMANAANDVRSIVARRRCFGCSRCAAQLEVAEHLELSARNILASQAFGSA